MEVSVKYIIAYSVFLIKFFFFVFFCYCFSDNIQKFRSPSEFSVVMGNVDRSLQNQNTLKLSVSNIITSDHFNYNTFRDDLALLILNQSIPETYKSAEIIKLNTNVNLKDGLTCYVSGWGLTENVSFNIV